MRDPRAPVERGALARMNATLTHRGPDSEGTLLSPGVGLAMRRLSIIDLAGGDQPISNEDGSLAVVQNGEIYNYRELRRDLAARGHRFSTHSDTEVLVHLYEEHGPGFVDRLRGMFAIALWDARRRRLMLARDRFGIKPLYYRAGTESLSFGSELKALLEEPDFSTAINFDALEAYLAWNWVPAPLTIFEGTHKLPPGWLLLWEAGELTLSRYARPAPAARGDLRAEGFDELAAELRERLRDSVRAHLIADVPVGVLLSGGVDSSAIAALAAEESAAPIKTFSIGFEERSFDELGKARLVADRYGTDHHELVVRPDAVELLPKIVDAFDEPFADSSALPTYLVSELAARNVKVALAGEGGDELFGGYFTYAADRLAPYLGGVASLLGPALERIPSSSGAVRLDDKARRFARGARLPPLERHCAWQVVFSGDARAELLAPDRRGSSDPIDPFRARFGETGAADPLARFQDLDLGINLVDDQLVKTDRTSMAHSLETRVPLLDTQISDLALSLPGPYKVRGLAKKRILRRAVEPLVPKSILSARKQGFSIPAAAWLRGELEPFAREVLAPGTLRSQGFFRPDAVGALVDAHVGRREDHSRRLWSLLMFTLWFERLRDRRPTTSNGAATEGRA